MNDDGQLPLLSVVVPIHGRLDLLRETIQSLADQSLRDAEFLLVDDASDDATRRFLGSLPHRDSRFRVLLEDLSTPRGAQETRNRGLDQCSGTWVVFLDSDDILHPDCLRRKAEFHRSYPNVDIAVGEQAILDESDGTTRWVNQSDPKQSDLDRFLSFAGGIDVPWVNAGCSLRVAALRGGGIRWRPEFPWDDLAFHFECLAAGLSVAWLPRSGQPDGYYRLHGGEHFGSLLSSSKGRDTTTKMVQWMLSLLNQKDPDLTLRKRRIARSWFHACLLPSLGADQFEEARAMLNQVDESKLFEVKTLKRLGRYVRGRRILRRSPRLTFWWNRWNRTTTLGQLLSTEPSRYGTESFSSNWLPVPPVQDPTTLSLEPTERWKQPKR